MEAVNRVGHHPVGRERVAAPYDHALRVGQVVVAVAIEALGQARTTLESHREVIAARFLEAFAESVEGALPSTASKVRSLKSLSFDELELMGDEQVQETVELARVQQVVKMAVEDELVMLDARLSSARGLTVVSSKANPLHPEAIIGALIRALSKLHIDEEVRVQWLHIGALPLGQELRRFYRQLVDLLDRWGVQPAGYKVVHVDLSDLAKAEAAIREHKPRMVWLETPTNPTLKLVDIEAVCRLAKMAGTRYRAAGRSRTSRSTRCDWKRSGSATKN